MNPALTMRCPRAQRRNKGTWICACCVRRHVRHSWSAGARSVAHATAAPDTATHLEDMRDAVKLLVAEGLARD
eukprot:6207066-Pleurochrysis_carterae.AAC.2